MQTITMTLDDAEAYGAISERKGLADGLRNGPARLIGRREPFVEPFRVNLNSNSAVGANDLRTRPKPTELLREFAAALRVRAGYGDRRIA